MNRKKAILWAIPIVLAAGLSILLFGCTTAAGTSIGGLDVGNQNAWQVFSQLRGEEKALQAKELTIRLPEKDITFLPRLHIPKGKLVLAALRQPEVPLEVHYREGQILPLLQEYAAAYDTTLAPSGYRLEGPAPSLSTREFDGNTQTLILDPGTPERHLDTQAVFTALDEFYSQLYRREAYRLTLEVPVEKEPEALDLEAIHRELTVEAVNDTLDMTTYGEVPGFYGYTFDLAEAKQQLGDVPLSLPMESIAPEIMGENLYFRDELGHCETKHTDDENRNTNLRLVCKALDGLILQPGEEFSYNGSVGERTAEKGYKPAGAYSGNRLVKDIGGGVCQGSTTLYNCALLADLEITERHGHGFTVNYVPIGLDAAVNWATKTDLRFRNSWHFPIQIKAEVSGGYIRMKLLGTDEKDYYIEMSSTRSEDELRIYSNSYKHKFDKHTGDEISKELEARSSYMYMQ